MDPNHNSKNPRNPCLVQNCPRCYYLFQQNPYNPPPYNPHSLQTSQQRFAEGSINMNQSHNNVRTNPLVVVDNQVKRTVQQHSQDNTMNRKTSYEYVPDFINNPFTNESWNAYLQRSASVPMTKSHQNTGVNIPHVQIRNDHHVAHTTARSNIAASTSQFQPNRLSNVFPTFIAPNEVNGRLITNNNKTYYVESTNMHEIQDLHNTKRVIYSNLTSSSEYANNNNNGQNNNSSENSYSDVVSPIADGSSRRESVVTKNQNNKSRCSSKTKTRSNTESLKEDDVSDDDVLIIDEDNTTQQTKSNQTKSQQQKPKTTKQIQSSSSREERMQFNSSDSHQSIMLNTVKNCIKLLHPTLYQTIDKSKTEPKQKLFKCRTCSKLFVEKEQLRKHLAKKLHNRKGKTCNKCQLKFSKKSINEHVKQHHNNERNLTQGDFDIVTDLSSSSSSSSSDSSDSESSTSSDRSEKNDRASTVNLISPNSSLKPHKPISSEERQVKQSNENQTESLKISLNIRNLFGNNKKFRIWNAEKPNASNSHTFVVFKCAECEKCFYQVDIDRHKAFCGQSKILQCDLCPLKFAPKSLAKHQKEHHSSTTLNTINLVIMENNENNSVKTETLTLAKRKKIYSSVNNVQKVSSHSKFVSNIMNQQKTKFTMTTKLLQTTYQSYSKTIYKCRICNICFATAPTMQSHINQNNHVMPTVRRCSICKLSFSNVVLERHLNFHHVHLKLKKKSDFIIKVRPILKPIVSTVNNKINHADSNERSSLRKREGVSEDISQQRRESDQSQKEPIPVIPNNNSNQDQSISNTELGLKDVNILYKCSQCDLYFMENTYYQNHLAANHKLLVETYYCTFCKYTYCVSIESFELHCHMHFKNKSIQNLIVENNTISVDTIQTSYNDQNNDKLEKCVINSNTAVTENHGQTNENNLLLKNDIQGRLNDHNKELGNMVVITNDNQEPIKILSNIVLNQPITKDYQQADVSNESQSKNTLKSTVDKKYKTLTNTYTNQVYNTTEQTPLILGDSNIIKDGNDNNSDLHCERNFEKHHSIHGSVVNLINRCITINSNVTKESETLDGCDSLRILTSSHTTESSSKPEQWYQNKQTVNFGDVKNDDPKKKEVSEIGPKLNNDTQPFYSEEQLLIVLEGYPEQQTTKPGEQQQNTKLESDSKDVIQPIRIKFRRTKSAAVTSLLNPDLPTSNEVLMELVDYEISDTNTDKGNKHCQRDIVTTSMNDDDFQRDVAHVENMIVNVKEETDDETSSSSDAMSN